MKKTFLAFTLGLSVLFSSPSISFAQASAGSPTIAQLQAQIAQLMSIVLSLQQAITALTPASGRTPTPTPAPLTLPPPPAVPGVPTALTLPPLPTTPTPTSSSTIPAWCRKDVDANCNHIFDRVSPTTGQDCTQENRSGVGYNAGCWY